MAEPESLDQDEPLQRRVARHAYDRLIMLSDGVFAIAITLSAIEIRAPEQIPDGVGALLGTLLPMLLPYAISFAVIAAYWAGHRRIISQLRRVDGIATVLTLCLLGLVALQPAAVQLLTRHGGTTSAVTLYYLLIVTTGIVQSLFWFYAAFVGRLVHPDVGRSSRWAGLARSLILPLASAVLSITLTRNASHGGTLLILVAVIAGGSLARLLRPRLAGLF